MKRITIFAAITALAVAPLAFAAGDPNATTTSILGVTVGPEASFTVIDPNTALTKSDTSFAAFGGTTNFTYKIRTAEAGSGSITVAVTAFGAGGPVLADLAYTCTATVGSGCSASTGASTTATSVVIFGSGVHSADAGSTGTAAWTLADRPTTKTGSYSSTATFTIAAL